MLVAVTTFKSVISPLFDAARWIQLYELRGQHLQKAERLLVRANQERARIELLKKKGAQVLVCGAISNHWRHALQHAGIQVYPWASGEVESVLALLAARGDSPSPANGEPARGPRFPAVVPAMGRGAEALVASHPWTSCCLALLRGGDAEPEFQPCPGRGWEQDPLATVHALGALGARALLTERCGPLLHGLLAVAGIEVFLGLNCSVGEAAREYAGGGMTPASMDKRPRS